MCSHISVYVYDNSHHHLFLTTSDIELKCVCVCVCGCVYACVRACEEKLLTSFRRERRWLLRSPRVISSIITKVGCPWETTPSSRTCTNHNTAEVRWDESKAVTQTTREIEAGFEYGVSSRSSILNGQCACWKKHSLCYWWTQFPHNAMHKGNAGAAHSWKQI